jgi:hypothetical protein
MKTEYELKKKFTLKRNHLYDRERKDTVKYSQVVKILLQDPDFYESMWLLPTAAVELGEMWILDYVQLDGSGQVTFQIGFRRWPETVFFYIFAKLKVMG